MTYRLKFAGFCAAALTLIGAQAAQAQSPSVMECDWQASARNIGEPWEDYSRTFSNGLTRVTMLDTIEPAAGWAYLMIQSPPYDELGARQCRIIGQQGMGFGGMYFNELQASYDPAQGLLFDVPVVQYVDGVNDRLMYLQIVLNQSTGEISTWLMDQ